MTPRTLKEVAQAGLVLGFEWIARDGDLCIYLHKIKPTHTKWCWDSGHENIEVEVTDYPELPPEKSLLKLSDIVEGKV